MPGMQPSRTAMLGLLFPPSKQPPMSPTRLPVQQHGRLCNKRGRLYDRSSRLCTKTAASQLIRFQIHATARRLSSSPTPNPTPAKSMTVPAPGGGGGGGWPRTGPDRSPSIHMQVAVGSRTMHQQPQLPAIRSRNARVPPKPEPSAADTAPRACPSSPESPSPAPDSSP